MSVIYKYPMEIADYQTIGMPIGSKILSVGNQGGELMLWVEVTESLEMIDRSFIVRGTGNPWTFCILDTFIGTAIIDPFVWHVYEWGRE